MDFEMVLNELSLGTPAADIQTARQWMSDFIITVRTATAQGVNRVIRTQSDFQDTILAPNYPLQRWRNDNEVDRDTRRFLNTLITKAPFLKDIANSDFESQVGLSEFKHQGESANGLGHAFVLDALAVSIRSEDKWDCSGLELEVKRLDENGNIIDERVEIIHASHSNHVQEHTDWIKSRIRTGVNDGSDLWSRKDELFSSLEFCEAVAKQLQGIRAGNIELQPVVKALFELENYSKNWKTGSFSLAGYPIEVSRESQPTLNKYRKQRTFRCLDGKDRLFDWHVKLRLCNWRIHFFPDVGPGKIIIGYVGLHLPTVSDPT